MTPSAILLTHTTMSTCLPLGRDEYASGSGSGARVQDEDELQLMWLGILLGAAGSIGIAIGELGMGRTSEEIKTNTHEGQSLISEKPANETLLAALNVKLFVYRAIFVVSAIANFVAFGFAPNPVLAPLEGLQFVSAFLWAVYYRKKTLFHEETKRIKKTTFCYALSGTVTTSVAIVGVVLFTPTIESTFGVEGLLCLWSRPEWVAVASTLSGVVVLLLVLGWASSFFSKPPTTMEKAEAKESVSVMLWSAFVPATVGAIGATLAKQISELLRVALSGGEDGLMEVFVDFEHSFGMVYTLGIATGFCFWYWFRELTNGMSKFEETLALPVYQGSYIVLTALLGGIFFDDFVNYNDVQLIGWAASLTLLVVGLAVIVVGAASSPSVPTSPSPDAQRGMMKQADRVEQTVKENVAHLAPTRPQQVPALIL